MDRRTFVSAAAAAAASALLPRGAQAQPISQPDAIAGLIVEAAGQK